MSKSWQKHNGGFGLFVVHVFRMHCQVIVADTHVHAGNQQNNSQPIFVP